MRAFPQLRTSALVQFPFRSVMRTRCVTNRTAEDRLIQSADVDFSFICWELEYSTLDRTECQALEQFFESCEGALQSFTFLDPNANLLSTSDDLSSSNWTKGPLLQVTPDQSDPWGGNTASNLINVSQVDQEISQTLPIPASFRYCFSAYGRSATSGLACLLLEGGRQPLHKLFPLRPQWARLSLCGSLGATGDSVRFAVRVPPGAAVQVAGMQVESGTSPTDYKRTSGARGVFPATYFEQDELEVVANGPNSYSCLVRLASRVG